MPRWNNSLENNCKDILDNIIKNISADLYQQLLLEVLESNIENNKKIIEQFLRNKLNLATSLSRHTKGYWLARGWSDVESYIKSKENKQKNCKSVYSQQTWLEKINPITGRNYTAEEADFERNSRRPIRKEYWIKKGYNDVESQKLAVEAKNRNNEVGADSSSISKIHRFTSKRCIEYYTVRGYTELEAKTIVSDRQKYFSKDICVQKYGEENGISIWQARQDKWQETLKSKPEDEILRINKLKLFKGGSVSKGESLLFEQLANHGIDCSKQHAILKNNTRHYVYDIVHKNKIIEYNGDFWHASPKKYKESDVVRLPNKTITAKEIWEKDLEKIKFAESQGYEVLVVWESDFKKNKEETIKQCIQFLTQ